MKTTKGSRARGAKRAGKKRETRKDAVRIIPLGGLGEFGMNCMVIESQDRRVVVDCGVQFPSKAHYGIDLLIPDFSYLEEAPEKLEAILLTHGHEDHIGAVPYLLKAVGNVPIYGTAFTLALVRRRLKEHNLHRQADLREIKAGEVTKVGIFEVEPIRVNHSTPDSMSLSIMTPAGRVLHTGDWRVDYTPVGEAPIDLHRFAQVGQEGVVAMIADSTNVQVPGVNPSESEVAKELEDIMDLAPGRVLITMFSSNVWRVCSILAAARRTGRKVAILGRSMQQYSKTAAKLGYLGDGFPDVLIDITEAKRYSDDELTVLLSGSQGEERSTLTRVAMGTHNLMSIQKGDWLIYSSRFIPGNEKAIGRVINEVCERGARVFTTKDRLVHCSGHARREEIKLLLTLVKPQVLIPAHGEYQQMRSHAELASSLGIPSVSLMKSGDVIEVYPDGQFERLPGVEVGQVYVDGGGIGDVEETVVRERRKIGAKGIAVVSLTMKKGALQGSPSIVLRGVVQEDEGDDSLLAGAEEVIGQVIESHGRDSEALSEELRVMLRRYFNKKIRRKPTVIPMITEL